MEIGETKATEDISSDIKNMCMGLDVFKARNRIFHKYPFLADRLEIQFIESPYDRFIVIDCEYDDEDKKVLLKVTSKNLIRHLPSMYQENDFLRKYLMIFQHLFNETSITLDNLDNIFRPMETPSKFLPLLASWFGVDFELLGDEQTARKVLQYSIPLYRYRGTRIGLKMLLYLVSGIVPEIIEGEISFDALNIIGENDIESSILNIQEDEAVFSVYFPVLIDEVKPDLVKRIYRIIQNEKPINTQGYLFFKKVDVKGRKTTTITEDTDLMIDDGIIF